VKRSFSIAIVVSLLIAAHMQPQGHAAAAAGQPELLHPTYELPVRCFAYVGNESDTKTWKIPYLLYDGRVDLKRLPAAIQAVLTGYRGRKVAGIPDDQMPDVVTKLGRAAAQAGKMPFQDPKPAAVYRQLQTALEQFGRLDEIKAAAPER
jgi:hypothetical protein